MFREPEPGVGADSGPVPEFAYFMCGVGENTITLPREREYGVGVEPRPDCGWYPEIPDFGLAYGEKWPITGRFPVFREPEPGVGADSGPVPEFTYFMCGMGQNTITLPREREYGVGVEPRPDCGWYPEIPDFGLAYGEK